MSLHHRLLLPFTLSALIFLAACGDNNRAPSPPPNGGFTNADLSGTYVFTSTGSDSALGGLLTMAGTFSADGNGNITTGVVDMNDPNFSGAVTALPITGGTYKVTADGRGTATLAAVTPFANSIGLAFVLTTTGHGLVTQFDVFGSGSGTLDLQTGTAISGTYVLNLSGNIGNNVVTGGGIPGAAAALVTVAGNGATTGSMDFNNNGTSSGLSVISPSIITTGSPGIATIATTGGTFDFDVYVIDSTHFKLIEVDNPAPILVGDAFSQTSTAFPTGAIAFTMAGVDFSGPAPQVLGGLMTSDGSSLITSGAEDVNDGFATTPTPQLFTGEFSASGNRYELTLDSFINGDGGTALSYTFAAYPSSGGVALIEIDGQGVTGGTAFAQTNTTFASGEGYGLNLTAVNSSSEEDDIAEFTNNSNTLVGLVDINDQGSFGTQNFNGSYAADTTNPGRGVLTSNVFNLATYTVDSENTIMIEMDNNQLGLGSIGQQAGTASAGLAQRLASMKSIKPRDMVHKKWVKKSPKSLE
jgi:hypothetical protein